MVDAGFDLALQANVAPLRAEVTAKHVSQVGRQDLPQPADQLRLAAAAEGSKVSMRFQESLLHKIGGIHLALEALANLHSGEERKVAAIQLEKPAQGCTIPRACLFQQLLGLYRHFRRLRGCFIVN